MNNIDSSQRTAAKVAGVTGLLTFAVVVVGNYVLLNPLIVSRDAVATAQNIVAHQTQVRLAAVCFLTYSLGVLVLLTSFYVVLKPINPGPRTDRRTLRLVLLYCGFLHRSICLPRYGYWVMPITYRCLSRIDCRYWRDYILARISMRTMWACLSLDWRQQFAPGCGSGRTTFRGRLSIFGVISSAWCVLCAFIFLIFPRFNKTVNDYILDLPMALFELAVSFWLLFKGLRPSGIYDSHGAPTRNI